MLNERFKIVGQYRTIVKRASGEVEIGDWINTIATALKEKVNDQFLASSDFALDSLFNGVLTPPTMYEDGIIIYDGAHWREMNCSSSKPTATSTKITGVLTGVAGTFTDIALGCHHSGVDNDTFEIRYADPTSWNNITLAAADEITIEWTISIT